MLRTGVDIVKIERIRRAISRYDATARARKRFLARLYTEAELRYCRDRAESLAVRFAAKEAIAKALGNWRLAGRHPLDRPGNCFRCARRALRATPMAQPRVAPSLWA